MEQASLEEKLQGVVATTSGDPSPVAIRLTVQKANHDDKIAYKFSEANRIGMWYQRAVGKQTADSECWFSLYEIVKTKPSDMDTADYLQVRTYEFKSFEKAIEFVETMLKTCGYEFRRRTGYEDVVYHNPERMAHDMGYTLSLLLAEHEWEASVMHYRKPVSHFKPRYLVTPDVPHTPQTKGTNSQKLEQEASSGSDAEKKWQDSVRKKLEFASDDSSESSPMVKAKMNDPTMNKFVRMAALGEISMSDLMRIITAFGEEPLKPSIATVNQLDATSKGSVKEKAKYMSTYSDGDLFKTAHLGDSSDVLLEVLQRISSDVIIIQSVEKYPNIEQLTHSLAIVFRVQTETGHMIVFRCIESPQLQRLVKAEGLSLAGTFLWETFDVAHRDARGECDAVTFALAGSIGADNPTYAKRARDEILISLVRYEIRSWTRRSALPNPPLTATDLPNFSVFFGEIDVMFEHITYLN